MSHVAQKKLTQLYGEYNHVQFPLTKDEPYRATLKTNAAQTCATIWLESKKTKLQWECVIQDLSKLMTTELALPNAVVLRAIKASAKLSSASKVDLTMEKDMLALDLAIHLSPVWTATYRFEMTPIEVKLVDILEARIRDLEEANARPRVAFCTLTTIAQTDANNIDSCVCEWTVSSSHEAAALVRIDENDKSSIVVLQPGLYHIHCTLTTLTAVTGEITLYVDEADVGTAPYTCYKPNEDEASWYFQVDVSHIAQLAAGAHIGLDGDSNDIAIPGSMTIRKLQQGAF
ncbi:hypothetical protein SPRG_03260 [Saprolegnia parasitica CBS 223.65]|uniref:Uncharacterized protein n=1 Tax=Saprolegnia parasitica (strain CBS 223.65) TaxID=695850 RepID=A0A067CZ02_SAPPC|nr:hypothetical protein SPRG_03260 [Saprolegnia parasitica CBS 223.65]KDO32042.1 hypothetical protein SPRG_03260 [Saprolegnia parasitica CBS 223.65]|eukprot:XP_012197230.1 hypothetical protein SPRG_03260 [Saprolegnia parasitica CBS 223.65]